MAPASNSLEITKKDVEGAAADAKTLIERLLGDISKKSAAQQIAVGATTGWYVNLTY